MEESTRPTIVSLASNLLADLRHLVAQELQLAKHEMQHDLSKLVKAAIQAGLALVLSLMAMILLWLTLVYLLHSLLGLSLWASYGLVALLAAAGAGGLAYSMIKVGSSVRLWPFRTLHTLKEDAQWIKAQVFSAQTGPMLSPHPEAMARNALHHTGSHPSVVLGMASCAGYVLGRLQNSARPSP